MKQEVRVRFAPSPTGLLHIGGVRTALFNYLFARGSSGQFTLRLEDTDRERFDESSVTQIEQSLQWLGLIPDEGYWLGEHQGAAGPYIQSERLPHYEKYAKGLVEQGLAYYSNATAADISAWRSAAQAAKQPFIYKKTLEAGVSEKKARPIRLDSAAVATKFNINSINWHDEVRGEFSDRLELIDDLIILKSDGFPTYNFANVVDDHLMKISHVIRGDEFIASTAKHMLLYKCLGWTPPKFAHLPTILGPDGKKKLSKRDGDVDLLEYKAKGYLPDALLNFLALLGWNDGTEQEIFSLKELIDKFSLERIQKSPAIFDINRLDWMNGVYIREKISESEYIKLAHQIIDNSDIKKPADLNIKTEEKIFLLDRVRVKKLADLPQMLDFFYKAPRPSHAMLELVCAKSDQAIVLSLLTQATQKLASCPDDTPATIEQALRQLAEELNIKTGQLFYPIRVAITGKTAAPGLFETINVLGLPETVRRLKNVCTKLG